MTPYLRKLLDRSLHGPVSDFKCRQGKRIRGSLLQLSYEMAGGVGTVPSPVSDAIESLHAGSLVIDDIQDDSRLRRGQISLHQTLGIPLAINAGNWMYFHALECLSDAQLPDPMRIDLLNAMIRTARCCHEGQAIDLEARVDRVPVEHWDQTASAISRLKTGSLVELAVRMGCIAAATPEPLLSVLPALGRRIGIALQMRNDLDELASITEVASIAPYENSYDYDAPVRDDDLRNSRMTWPWVWASQLTSHEQCRKWSLGLDGSQKQRWNIGKELFLLTGQHGDRVIADLVTEQMHLTAEHVIDHRLLDQMSEILQAIKQPSWPDAAIEGMHLRVSQKADR